MGARARVALGAVLAIFLGASAAYSANFARLRDRFPPPATRVEGVAASTGGAVVADGDGTGRRSFPWWQEVEQFSGTGNTTTGSFTISERALQWRVRWECSEKPFSVVALDADGNAVGHDLVDAEVCPELGTGFSVRPGDAALDITSGGPWKVTVEQQLDVPLHEEVTPEMKDGKVVATGVFYDMERDGEGTMSVYRINGGGMMLRLEDFYVTPNVDLEIDVSDRPEPKDAAEFLGAKRDRLAMLPITTGDMNFEVPDDVDLRRWNSIVVYCEPLSIAYTAVTLTWNKQ